MNLFSQSNKDIHVGKETLLATNGTWLHLLKSVRKSIYYTYCDNIV